MGPGGSGVGHGHNLATEGAYRVSFGRRAHTEQVLVLNGDHMMFVRGCGVESMVGRGVRVRE